MPLYACSHEGCTVRCFRDDMYRVLNDYVCHSCYRSHYLSCSECGVCNLRDSFIRHNGYYFCQSCRVSAFSRCFVCSTEIWRGGARSFFLDGIEHVACGYDCLSRSVYRCGDCGANHRLPLTVCPTKYPPLPTDYKKCYLPDRVFGLELETTITKPAVNGWTSVTDGSIIGLEYLSGPILGEDAIKRVENGCLYLNKDGPCVDKRCGFHLHINAKDKSEEQIARFVHMCYTYEEDFKNMVPKRRRNLRFCLDLPQEYDNCSNIEDCVYKIDQGFHPDVRKERLMECKRNKYHDSRYYWVNLHSYYYRGTVEIRLHSGTTLPEKILRWSEMWLKLFEWTTSAKYDSTLLGKKSIWGILKISGVRKSTIDFYRERTSLFSPKKIELPPIEPVVRRCMMPSDWLDSRIGGASYMESFLNSFVVSDEEE